MFTSSVIPTPYQVRGKLQWESRLVPTKTGNQYKLDSCFRRNDNMEIGFEF